MHELKLPDATELEQKARELRIRMLKMLNKAGSGHPGGSLSCMEILTTLYYHEMNVDPRNPKDPDRDRLILSKGHACPALYTILADKGYYPVETLDTLRTFGSILQGHPDSKKVPGVEISSGSLGMGISFGVGTALGAKMDNRSYRTYVITGCGEHDEGQNWEAYMSGFKYGLDNLTVIVDYNKVQLDGTNDQIMPLGSLCDKIKAFGWNVVECDGHSISELLGALEQAKACKGVPTAILAHTIKGKGVSFMEGKSGWHGKQVDDESLRLALQELGGDR